MTAISGEAHILKTSIGGVAHRVADSCKRIDRAIAVGEFASTGSMSALDLEHCASALRGMADDLDVRRKAVIAADPQKPRLVRAG